MRSKFFPGLVLLLITSNATVAQTTAFTYQGKLANNGNPANGDYDFQFKLFDASSNGSQIGDPLTFDGIGANPPFVSVANGIFNVTLDFVNCPGVNPTCFNGAARFLEIAVKPHGGGSFPPPLTPRQPITSTPYAVKSVNAANATTADGLSVACVSCVTSSQIASVNGSAVTGTIPVASVPAGSTNYIQNSTSPQTSPSNFNVSGNGTADIFNAVTQFNIGGDRILSNGGPGNLFAGVGAGGAANTGNQNSFFGSNAGNVNMNGSSNAFFGSNAGSRNKGGNDNSFFGRSAGERNEFESGNTFIGSFAGFDIGDTSSTNNFNTFIGDHTGIFSRGARNVFVGKDAGAGNGRGNSNTAIGESASFFFTNLVNATAIGSLAQVMQSNSLVLGSITGVNNATADTNVGIGTTAPATRLHVSGTGVIRARINSDSNAGLALTLNNQPKWSVATTTGGNFLIFNDAITQNAFFIDAATNVIGINALGSAGSSHLCINGSNQISGCSSSMRYKTNIATLHRGLNLINRLRPVTFDWKQNGEHDLGLVAEEVAKVEPLLVTHNDKGEIEGVKYDRISVALVNAVREQQSQIERQEKLIEAQQLQLESLKRLVCAANPTAELCVDNHK